jgi:hypothetical protein
MRRVSLRASLLGFIVLGSCVAGSGADLIRVPYDYPTITDACEVAQPGDTVGVYPGQYFEYARINPGVSVVGMTPDSMLVWVRASGLWGPFATWPGSEPVIIENMTIWGGQYFAVANANPNLVIQRCYLYAYDYYETGDFSYLVSSEADFELRNCMILFGTLVEDNMFQLGQPARVLMEDCVIWGEPFLNWDVPAGSRFEFRNNTIDGAFDVYVHPPYSTDFSLIVVNSITTGVFCTDHAPDTVEWRYNDFFGRWPECGYMEGNFEADPLWCDPWPGEMDYRLEPESPCRGAGENGEDVGARIGICWDPSSVPESAGAVRDFWVSEPWPNPTRGDVTLSLTTGSHEPVAVEVLDISGRVLCTLSGSQLLQGNVISWDGRLRGGRKAPAGVYYLRVGNGGREKVTRQVIVIR